MEQLGSRNGTAVGVKSKSRFSGNFRFLLFWAPQVFRAGAATDRRFRGCKGIGQLHKLPRCQVGFVSGEILDRSVDSEPLSDKLDLTGSPSFSQDFLITMRKRLYSESR